MYPDYFDRSAGFTYSINNSFDVPYTRAMPGTYQPTDHTLRFSNLVLFIWSAMVVYYLYMKLRRGLETVHSTVLFIVNLHTLLLALIIMAGAIFVAPRVLCPSNGIGTFCSQKKTLFIAAALGVQWFIFHLLRMRKRQKELLNPFAIPRQPFSPPSTWNARRVSQLQFYDQDEPKQRIDPLIAAIVHNKTCSPLVRLPPELQCHIMRHVSQNPIDFYALRVTSRDFLSMSKYSTFQHIPLPGQLSPSHPQRLRDLVRIEHIKQDMASLKKRLDRDMDGLCSLCRTKHTERLMESESSKRIRNRGVYCRDCMISHPNWQFSRKERSQISDTQGEDGRICIAREGHVRICKHKVIKWEDWIRATAVPPGTPFTWCDHPDHISHHHQENISSGVEGQAPPEAPQVCMNKSSLGGPSLMITWRGHLQLEPPLDQITGTATDPNAKLTPEMLRQQLEEFRKASPAEYLAPVLSGGRLPELQCFDASICNCLHYEGAEKLLHGRVDPMTYTDREEDPPDSESSSRYFTKGSCGSWYHSCTIPTARDENISRIEITMAQCMGRCLSIQYTRVIKLFSLELRQVQPHPSMSQWTPFTRDLATQMDREVIYRYHTSPTWYQALDPDSYGLRFDEETRGNVWCDTKGCKYYHGYFKDASIYGRQGTEESEKLPIGLGWMFDLNDANIDCAVM